MKKMLATLIGLASVTGWMAFARQDGAAPAAAVPPEGLRASILLQEAGRDRQPVFREVGPRELFYSGDRFRFRFRSARAGYVYILLHSSDGQSQLLFPQREDVQRGDYYLRRSESATFPKDSSFCLDNHAGTERLWIVQSARPIAELDDIANGESDLTRSMFQRYTSPEPVDPRGVDSKGIMRTDEGSDGTEGTVITVLPLRMTHLAR
jgi:hypothetical protein